jgi:secreted PhoX family phosphatase
VVNAWGDPLMPGAPAFRSDASQPAAAQRRQAGMNHDGMAFFPLPRGSLAADRGLLAVNFEYTDDNLLTTEGMEPWTADKVSKSQAAHGIGVFEVSFGAGGDGARWRTVPSSHYGRRITANTAIDLTGPAAGHDLLKTDDDPTGRLVKGTFNNCAGGRTPWDTWLSCEENVAPYFVNDSTARAADWPNATASPAARTAGASAGTSSTRASMPPATPTNPTATAGWSSSTPTNLRRRPSSGPRWAAWPMRGRPPPSPATDGWCCTWGTMTSGPSSSTSTSSSATAPPPPVA